MLQSSLLHGRSQITSNIQNAKVQWRLNPTGISKLWLYNELIHSSIGVMLVTESNHKALNTSAGEMKFLH
jgi:hypothetical protein